MRALARRHPVAVYSALAYALSWAWWIPMAVRGDVVRTGDGWPTHLPGLAGPALAAVAVTALVDGRPGLADLGRRLARWRVGRRWWLLVAGTAALVLLGPALAALTGGEIPSAADLVRYPGIGEIGVLAVLVAFLVGGVGEETGWRGFAADRLLADHDLTRTALLVAAVWGGWHLPLFWINESFRSFGPLVIGWAVGLVAASVVLTWMHRESGRSILLVAAWHTAFNVAAATEGGGDFVPVIATALVITLAVWVLRSERARRGAGVAG